MIAESLGAPGHCRLPRQRGKLSKIIWRLEGLKFQMIDAKTSDVSDL
jgi:hypothetical protein